MVFSNLFGSKKSEDGEVKRKRKRGESLTDIFEESVFENVIGDFKSNEPFIVEKDGKTLYVGALLKADDIGGFGKRSVNAEDKGQIIEQMASGAIKIYASGDLLSENELIVIPDAGTLTNIDEYGILRGYTYKVVYVSDDNDIIQTDYDIDFDTLKAVGNDEADIYDVLESLGETGFDTPSDESEAEDEAETQTNMPPAPPTLPAEPEEPAVVDMDEFGDVDGDIGDDGSDDVPFGEELPEETPEQGNGEFEGEPEELEEPEPEVVVSRDEMDKALKRKFYSDDLGLEISTDPFDQQFLHLNPYIPFDENRGEGWLNKYVNEISKDANVEMSRLHQTNLFKARNLFFEIISKQVEKIQKELDFGNPEGRYGKAYAEAQQQLNNSKSNLEQDIASRKAEMEALWQKEMEEVGESARRSAIQQYQERYRSEHESKLFGISNELKNQFDSEYNKIVTNLHDEKREEARKLMDLSISETLREVSAEYKKDYEAEIKQYAEWHKRMKDFIDDHRKDEVAHDQVLAKELAQSSKAEQVMAEYAEKLKHQTEEFDARTRSMKAEIESMKRKADERVNDSKAECDSRIESMRQELSEQKAEMDKLLDRYANLDKTKDAEYKARLAEANDEKIAWVNKCEHVMSMNKKANVLSVALAVVACITFSAVGLLIGSNMNLNFGSKQASNEIVQQYNRKLDRLEREKENAERRLERHSRDTDNSRDSRDDMTDNSWSYDKDE